jgi:hypothetical protein
MLRRKILIISIFLAITILVHGCVFSQQSPPESSPNIVSPLPAKTNSYEPYTAATSAPITASSSLSVPKGPSTTVPSSPSVTTSDSLLLGPGPAPPSAGISFGNENRPLNGATNISVTQIITWNPVQNATGYDFKLALDSGFRKLIEDKNNIQYPLYSPPMRFEYNTTYYWEVRAHNATMIGDWYLSSFTTVSKPTFTPPKDYLSEKTWYPPAPATVIYTATYIPLSSCSSLVQAAVKKKNLPENQIHSFWEQDTLIDTGESVSVVGIYYGRLHGDVYDEYVGAFVNGQDILIDLPEGVEIADQLFAHPPLINTFNQFEGSAYNRYSVGYQTVAFRFGFYGWIYKITAMNFTFVKLNDARDRVINQHYEMSGEIFVYFDSKNNTYWDYSGLNVSLKSVD